MVDPAQDQGRNSPQNRMRGPALVALIISVASATAPITQRFEGYEARAEPDPVGILTYCYGETAHVNPALVYSKDECAILMRVRMQKAFAPPLLNCVPDFANPRNHFAFEASLDASYNAGPRAVCRSEAARNFNNGRWAAGCASFPGWYVTARGRPLKGLVTRREDEDKHCMLGER